MMDDGKSYYLIHRVFTKDEMRDRPLDNSNNYFYGWCDDKKILNAFRSQRNKKKYAYFKSTLDEIGKKYSHNDLPLDKKLDLAPLVSVETGEKIHLIMTAREVIETKIRIKRMIKSISSISNICFTKKNKEVDYYVEMLCALQDKYFDALHYIGFRPIELESKYDSVDENDIHISEIEMDEEWEGTSWASPHEIHSRMSHLGLPRKSVVDDVVEEIFLSVESFVRILREELE